MQDSILSQSPSGLSSKQTKLLDELNLCIVATGTKIVINPKDLPTFQTVALDTEHNESGEFVGCGIYNGNGIVYYFTDLLSLRNIPFHLLAIVCHNGISDIECLNTWGINVSDRALVWDTMLFAHIIDSSQKDYSLKGMAKRELGIAYPSYDDIVGKRGCKAVRITLDKQPVELVAAYNSMDVYSTWMLYEKQRKALNLETL